MTHLALIYWLLSLFLLGFSPDTLPKIQVVDSEKKLVIVLKPVVDRSFFDSLSAIRSGLGAQQQVMGGLIADVVPKAEFDALIAEQKSQNARLKRIFNKLPAEVQRQIVVLDSLESITPSTPEKKSLDFPEITIKEPETSFFDRVKNIFKRKKHK